MEISQKQVEAYKRKAYILVPSLTPAQVMKADKKKHGALKKAGWWFSA